MVSGSRDDVPARQRGALPPPGLSPGDAPDVVEVPRMSPPPPSLEAMVQSRNRTPAGSPGPQWLLWIVLVLVAAAVTAYVLR